MITFSVERAGFTDCKLLVHQLFTDLEANGFTRKFPTPPAVLQATDLKCTFEANIGADTLFATQPWRLQVQAIDESKIDIFATSPLQLPDTGEITLLADGNEYAGHMGLKNIYTNAIQDIYFINRSNLQATQRAAFPMSYRLTVTPHGVALVIWEPGSDNLVNNQSWFVVQRLVNNTTGAIKTTGKLPVFCVFGIKHLGTNDPVITPSTDTLKRFVVRESDILRPTIPVDATSDLDDAARVINTKTSVVITEDNNYVIAFPNGLNTQRYAYPTDEIDMIAYTSADVISQNSDAAITIYGEAGARTYRAMNASQLNNTGNRILILKD